MRLYPALLLPFDCLDEARGVATVCSPSTFDLAAGAGLPVLLSEGGHDDALLLECRRACDVGRRYCDAVELVEMTDAAPAEWVVVEQVARWAARVSLAENMACTPR